MENLVNILQPVQGVPVMVVGDLMLDRFISGDVNRISPESPVPVLTITGENKMLGGAGNVLANLRALGAVPCVFAVVGDDDVAKDVRAMVGAMGVDVGGLITDASRPTTIKTRYLARHQQLLRSDFEKTHPLPAPLEKDFLQRIEKAMASVKAVVLSDYGKGVLGASVICQIMALASAAKIPVLVDPKGHDYTIYRGANIVTPNRKELALAAGVASLKTDDEIQAAAEKIISTCDIAHVVATRSEDGLSVFSFKEKPVHIPAKALEVFDVSGAGDTVIATLAAVLASGGKLADAAMLANIAAGIAVAKVGTTPVSLDEVMNVLTGSNTVGVHQSPLQGWDAALEQVRQWQEAGYKVGLTNGCFDILHAGHVNYLNQARARCTKLVVALNHDVSVKLLKGPSRPVNDEGARATVIGGLSCVDLVVLFGADKAGADNTPCTLIERLRPDIYFKGGDYTKDTLPETKIVEAYGGTVAIMDMFEGYSTTNIIEKSRKSV